MSWQKNLRKTDPYTAGEQPKIQNLIKLNTNENPYGPGEKVKQAIKDFDSESLKLYPDPDASRLKHALALYHGLEDDQVFIGNGSDEVLALTFLACFNGDQDLLFPDITYSFYPVYCKLYNINYQQIPLKEDFTINKEDYYRSNGGIIFPNPNAPTGIIMSLEDIEDILVHNKESIVVVDEAYIDFGGESCLPLLSQYDNLLIIRTFSKFRSLAGIRLGAAYGNKELISYLYDIKNSFNSYPVDRLAQAIGYASVCDSDSIKKNALKIINTRERVSGQLKELGFSMPHSYSNFLFISHNTLSASYLFDELRKEGIVVRYFNSPRIDNYLRVTIGTDEQMNKFLNTIKDILARK